jgi:glycine oxidase
MRYVLPFRTPLPEVAIAGAGIIGLSLALELQHRGVRVTVIDTGKAMGQSSTAAAGMLAAEDPHNPPALLPLSRLSLSLYPMFLQRIEALSGLRVPFQTDTTIQHLPNGQTLRLAEHSLDPHQLAAALLLAVRATTIQLHEHTRDFPKTYGGSSIDCTGAWCQANHFMRPRKGQMLRVQMPADLPLHEAYRSEHAYILPRTLGPQAGTALIGATLEDIGFDLQTHTADLNHLRSLAAQMVPEFFSSTTAPELEAWAGLRPGTPDDLPLIGELSTNKFIATGHFRNGILLAPATAVLLADLIEGKQPDISLATFSPHRFADIRPIPSDNRFPALR